MNGRVTTADILQAAGLKSSKTLTRWHKRGLIPRPVIGTHPNGRGKVGWWPGWSVERCRKIARMTRNGYSLGDIERLLRVPLQEPRIDVVERPDGDWDVHIRQGNSVVTGLRVPRSEVTSAAAMDVIVALGKVYGKAWHDWCERLG